MRTRTIMIPLICISSLLGFTSGQSTAQDTLAEKRTIVFLGDSITQAGIKRGGFVTLFEKGFKQQVIDKYVLAANERARGELNAQLAKVQQVHKQFTKDLADMRKGQVRAQVKLDQRNKDKASLEAKVASNKKDLARLQDFMKEAQASGKIEISGKEISEEKLKTLAQSTIQKQKSNQTQLQRNEELSNAWAKSLASSENDIKTLEKELERVDLEIEIIEQKKLSIPKTLELPRVEAVLARDKVNKSIKVIGAGISGNKVPDLQKRLEKDVLNKKPNLVFIYIGINDVWHSGKGNGTSKEDYAAGLQDIIKRIQDVGSKVILCTPSVIGEKTDGSNEFDEMLEEYAAISRRVAAETDVQLLDLRKAFIDHLKTANPDNKKEKVLTRDGVHLNADGNRFVADQMLSAMSAVPSTSTKSVRHIVLFKFKDTVDDAQVEEVVSEFANLKNQISEIADYEAGTNVSPENLDQGFTHCFVVTFNSIADRDAYLPHPAHKKFVELLDGKIDKVLVFDFVNE